MTAGDRKVALDATETRTEWGFLWHDGSVIPLTGEPNDATRWACERADTPIKCRIVTYTPWEATNPCDGTGQTWHITEAGRAAEQVSDA